MPTAGGFRPEALELGEVPVGEVAVGEVAFSALAGGTVRAVRFVPDDGVFGAFRVAEDGGLPLVGAELGGAPSRVEVRFGPYAPGRFDATMELDLDGRTFPLPIRAEARAVEPARLVPTPEALDFGEVAVGAALRREVAVTNQGEVAGLLVAAELTGPGFEVEPIRLPLPLRPEATVMLGVRYRPEAPSSLDEGVLSLALETGSAAAVGLTARARDGGPGLGCPDRPVHLGAVARGERLTGSVRCERLDSGWVLDRWRLAPGSEPGFEVAGPPADREEGGVEIPLGFEARGAVGLRRAELDLVDRLGFETRVAVTATIVAPRPGEADVFVELSWDTAGGDLDLHLVRQGGRRFESSEDCYFGSKNPDWGRPQERLDDPFLDRDDREGFGPEQIALISAAEDHYDVYVQFHDDAGLVRAPVATVRWQTRAGSAHALSRALVRCGDGWRVGRFEREGPGFRFVEVDAVDRDYAEYAVEACR